jgi:IS66 C-terminal element
MRAELHEQDHGKQDRPRPRSILLREGLWDRYYTVAPRLRSYGSQFVALRRFGDWAMVTLIATAKLYDVDPLARLADVLARIASTPFRRLPELPPWE